MSYVVPTIFTAVNNFSGPVKGMGKDLLGFGKIANDTASNISESFAKAGKSVAKGFKAALTGVAIASPLIYAAKSAIDFEDNMTGVAKTAGLAGKQLEEVGAGILEISKHTRTGIKDLQTIAEVGGRLGVAGGEILKFVDASNKFAVALGSDYGGGVEEAITQVGKIKNLFKQTRAVPIDEVITRAGSAINELTSIGATAENINDFVLRVGALPDAIKPSFASVSALGAFLEKVGIDSQIGASGFSNFLLVAAKNIGGFASQMKLSQKAASQLLATDPTAFAIKFATSLNGLAPTALAARFKNLKLESQESIKVIGALGGNTALLTTLQGRASDAYVKGTSLQDEYNKVNSTTAAKIQIAKNNFEALSILIGTKLLPRITPLIDKASDFITKIGMWIEANPKAVATIEKLTIAVVAASFAISAVNFIIAGYRTAVAIATTVTALWRVALVGLSFAQGVLAVMTGTSTGLLIGNKAAMFGTVVATNAVTAAQWLWNAAMTANPIGLIIVGIAALIAVIVVVVKKWDSWGAAVSLFLGPLGLVISMFKSFYNNWEMIKKAFKTDGILGGLKAIGKTLLDAVLMPLQQILQIAGKLPGKLGEMARNGAANIEQFRKDLGVNVTSSDSPTSQPTAPATVLNPKIIQQQSTVNAIQTNNANVSGQILIKNQTNNDVSTQNMTGPIGVNVKPNVASWNKK